MFTAALYIHYSQKVETIQMCIHWRMNTMWHIHTNEYHSAIKNEWNSDTHNNMDEPWKQYTKWKTTITNGSFISPFFIAHVWAWVIYKEKRFIKFWFWKMISKWHGAGSGEDSLSCIGWQVALWQDTYKRERSHVEIGNQKATQGSGSVLIIIWGLTRTTSIPSNSSDPNDLTSSY
jgi:hypothetical protein